MARIQVAPGVIDDLDRILNHLEAYDAADAESRAGQVLSALDVLADNPLIGRPAGGDKNELLIGRDATGYVALYRYLPVLDTVLVLAIRAQREAGYALP